MSEEIVEEVVSEDAPAVGEQIEAPVTEEVAAPAAFDWSFQFQDETKEVPEDYRWFEEAEKAEKLKDLYQRAEALEYQKQQSSTFKSQYEGSQKQLSEYEPVINQVKQLQQWYGENDHKRVLESLGYTKEDLYKIAQDYIELDKMPEHERQLHNQNRQAQVEREQLIQQNEVYKSRADEQLRTLTRIELDSALRDETASKVAEAYDAKHGAGMFRQLVIAQGEATVARLGRHVHPSELVPGVVKQFAPFMSMGAESPAGAAHEIQGSVGIQNPNKVIPNPKGKSASVGRSSVSSIQDLKDLRQKLHGG